MPLVLVHITSVLFYIACAHGYTQTLLGGAGARLPQELIVSPYETEQQSHLLLLTKQSLPVGNKPIGHILDNKAPDDFKQAIRDNGCRVE